MGRTAYLNRFSVKLSQMTAPLWELMKKNVYFLWQQQHQEALEEIKTELCKAQIINYCHRPQFNNNISMWCQYPWCGGMDKTDQRKRCWKNSRNGIKLSHSDRVKVLQHRKRVPGSHIQPQKFEYFLLGWKLTVETDYSPLEQIFEKNQSLTLSRFQWFILKCLKFDIQVKYKPRKTIPVADALSRVCVTENRKGTAQHQLHNDKHENNTHRTGKRGINSWANNEPCWRTQYTEDGHNTENNTWQHFWNTGPSGTISS